MFISDRLVLLAAAACDPEQDKSLENGLTETGTSLFWPFGLLFGLLTLICRSMLMSIRPYDE